MENRYNAVSKELVEELKKVVGKENVHTDPGTLDRYKTDEEQDARLFHLPEAVVAPGSTEEVADIMKLANKYVVPVTPRGGGTSVSCGAIPVYGGIVLLLERMNKIIEINEDGNVYGCRSRCSHYRGTTKGQRKRPVYAGDPCSAESCLIGGNLATNAGWEQSCSLWYYPSSGLRLRGSNSYR